MENAINTDRDPQVSRAESERAVGILKQERVAWAALEGLASTCCGVGLEFPFASAHWRSPRGVTVSTVDVLECGTFAGAGKS